MGVVLQDQQTPLQPAVNIPGYEIGVLDNQLKVSLSIKRSFMASTDCTALQVSWPESDYVARYDGILNTAGQILVR